MLYFKACHSLFDFSLIRATRCAICCCAQDGYIVTEPGSTKTSGTASAYTLIHLHAPLPIHPYTHTPNSLIRPSTSARRLCSWRCPGQAVATGISQLLYSHLNQSTHPPHTLSLSLSPLTPPHSPSSHLATGDHRCWHRVHGCTGSGAFPERMTRRWRRMRLQ
jgi:hypothetical protein